MRATSGVGLLAGEGRAKMNWNLFRREIRECFSHGHNHGPVFTGRD